MAQLNLLQIVQAVTAELGLVQPSVIVGAADLQTLQLYNLVNREGDNLKRTHNWTALQTLFTLNVGSPLLTTGNVTNGSAVITQHSDYGCNHGRNLCGFGNANPCGCAGADGR